MVLPFDHTYIILTLKFQGQKFEIALFQEWEGW